MMKTTFDFIARALNGDAISAPCDSKTDVSGITWDSREIVPGCAFLALRGERVDGNEFIVPAIELGANVIIATSLPNEEVLSYIKMQGVGFIFVKDAIEALSELAGAYRATLDAVVIGITGSSGKTTTKNIMASVLSRAYITCATQGNHNNELGVPYTVLSADADTQALVVELGMRGRGQIEKLCAFVRPTIGLITNIGVTHMELLGDRENIAFAKGELLSALPDGSGCAVLCGDDPFTPFIIDNVLADKPVELLSYGFSAACDVRGSGLSVDEGGNPSFEIVFPDKRTIAVSMHLPGEHNARNALGVAAVAYHVGMDPAEIAKGIESVHPSSMRFEECMTEDGVRVINDAYNANPDSMRASLDTLCTMRTAGKRIAVLGGMGELGDFEVKFHRELGAHVARSAVDLLVCIGTLAEDIATGALDAGMDPENVIAVDTIEAALEVLRSRILSEDIVLVKASRFLGLERLVKGLVD
ncbi:MAG: UDP-N-acetylmuramoyl-tripeptide--D-alanyl-D-alanine ligase [Actinobacteria bacterium]|nr:UDP-N-acetylmuramoyl-tripeptide--D-alanyl-D-alanine ligase [Actinomycetota bacterium]